MTPGTDNLLVYASDTLPRTYTFRVGTESGALYDFTSASARLTVSRENEELALLTLTNGSGITLGGAAGTVAVLFTASQTGTLGEGRYRWALQITLSSNVTRTYMQGRLTIRKAVVL